MVHVKIALEPLGREGRKGKAEASKFRVVYRILHNKGRRLIDAGYTVDRLNQLNGESIANSPLKDEMNADLTMTKGHYLGLIRHLNGSADSMTIDQIKNYLVMNPRTVEDKPMMPIGVINPNIQASGRDVFKAFQEYENSIRERGKERHADLFRDTQNKLKKWWKVDTMDFASLNTKALIDFEKYLDEGWVKNINRNGKLESVKMKYAINSISLTFRNIRTVFNYEIAQQRISFGLYPFKSFNIKVNHDTKHKDLTLETIRRIRDIDLSEESENVQISRDMFMLSYRLCGINLADMWELDLNKRVGLIDYVRAKTGKYYRYTIPKEAEPLIEKYFLDGKLIFRNSIKLYSSFYKKVEKGLWEIGKKVGMEDPRLTYYHARHTLSTLLVSEVRASEEEVEKILGHGAKKVVHRYVNPAVNIRIIDALNFTIQAITEGQITKKEAVAYRQNLENEM